jgi:hypothetical protein
MASNGLDGAPARVDCEGDEARAPRTGAPRDPPRAEIRSSGTPCFRSARTCSATRLADWSSVAGLGRISPVITKARSRKVARILSSS